ncbi:CBL-interacting serine/threonine-protein kinase 25-like [Corylus avellana]|uniref:CBL-interacting serine/threonine-protein kinase 25-like n=1 Tax=Corylus avellana TaxID=13451 RepID=UPI00286BCD4F|nr:CBL-interacting serine/threonine-protein kinase 25-like [Corylus avellana]
MYLYRPRWDTSRHHLWRFFLQSGSGGTEDPPTLTLDRDSRGWFLQGSPWRNWGFSNTQCRGFSYCDLKPVNLLLDDNEDLKVFDFGLSVLPKQLWNDRLLHTQCGTPTYVVLEVLRNKGYDGAKSDIWSCGVIIFVLLAGYLQFQADNLMKIYRKVFKAEFEFPQSFSTDAKQLISQLYVSDPAKSLVSKGVCKVNSALNPRTGQRSEQREG